MVATTRKTLIQRAGEGHPDSWCELAQMYTPLIQGKLHEARLPEEDVEDLTQEILLQLHRKLNEFKHNGRAGAFRRWLRVVTVNQTRSYLRRRPHMKRVSLEEIEPLADDESVVAARFDRQHRTHVISVLLGRLSGEFTTKTIESFQRTTIGQEDPLTVSRALDTSVQAIYIAKSRVLKRLRELAADYEITCEPLLENRD